MSRDRAWWQCDVGPAACHGGVVLTPIPRLGLAHFPPLVPQDPGLHRINRFCSRVEGVPVPVQKPGQGSLTPVRAESRVRCHLWLTL